MGLKIKLLMGVLVLAVSIPAFSGGKTVSKDFPVITRATSSMSWDDVIAESNGQTVTFHFWGGNIKHNDFVCDYVHGRLMEKYNVGVNCVLIESTMASVNQVMGEYKAGITEDGSIDMIWINGNSYYTLRQADLLFGPYAAQLPNAKYIAENNPGWTQDFGNPVEGYESHWGHGKFILFYDSDGVANPPDTVDGLLDWICANPGRFTYPVLPTFTGRRFVTEIFYRVTGGVDQWIGEFTPAMQANWDEKSPLLWDALNRIEPCLWRKGATYPTDRAPLDDLYANGEVDWGMATGAFLAASRTKEGIFPPTTTAMVFDDGTVSDTHYVGIMRNSPNKAGALLLANELQDPEVQLYYADPATRGDIPAVSLDLLPPDIAAKFAALDFGQGSLSTSDMNKALPGVGTEIIKLMEDGWQKYVVEQ
jgi:putative spermidine/putrescine transport system substrate-binding protein